MEIHINNSIKKFSCILFGKIIIFELTFNNLKYIKTIFLKKTTNIYSLKFFHFYNINILINKTNLNPKLNLFYKKS